MLEFRPAPGRLTDRLRRRDRAGACPADTLAGLCVVLTDACSDIGRATAAGLARRGVRLVLVDRDTDRLHALRDEITGAGGLARARRCDLSALGDIDQLVEWVRGEFGAVDVLVNNARGVRPGGTHSRDRFREYQHTMAANYFGPLRLTLGLLPAMRHSRSGLVVNVGPRAEADIGRREGSSRSTRGSFADVVDSNSRGNAADSNARDSEVVSESPGGAAACAGSAAAWTTFGQCAELEVAPHGIRVHTVHYPIAAPDADPARTAAATAREVESAVRGADRPTGPAFARALRGLAGR